MHRCGRINGSFEIVAERGAKRGLIAFLHDQVVDDGRPQFLRVDMEKPGQCLGFGFEPLGTALGFSERLTRTIKRLACGGMRGLRAQGGGFRRGDCGLRAFGVLGKRRQIGPLHAFGGNLFEFRLYRCNLVR